MYEAGLHRLLGPPGDIGWRQSGDLGKQHAGLATVHAVVHGGGVHAQAYVVCELPEKLNVLWAFIKSHLKASSRAHTAMPRTPLIGTPYTLP